MPRWNARLHWQECKDYRSDSCHEIIMQICIENGPRRPLNVHLNPLLFILKANNSSPRADAHTDRGAVRGRWAIHQSSFIRAGDDRYPSSDPELARPQSWPQSEQPEFPRIGRRLLLPLLKLIPSLLSHSQTFAQLWSFSNGSSVDGCCSGELLISMLYQVFYEIKI